MVSGATGAHHHPWCLGQEGDSGQVVLEPHLDSPGRELKGNWLQCSIWWQRQEGNTWDWGWRAQRETEKGETDRETDGMGRQHGPSHIKNPTCPVVSTYTESLNSEIQMKVGGQFSKNADTDT